MDHCKANEYSRYTRLSTMRTTIKKWYIYYRLGRRKHGISYIIYGRKTRTNNLFPIFSSHDWWITLAKNALELSDEFEMRLWEDDEEAIKSGEKFEIKVPNNQSKEIVYRGSITPDFKQEVLTNYLASEGYIKWF